MDSSGRRKRVSARHQVKRLDRIFEEFALGKTGPAEETGFLRSVRIFRSAISPASKPQVKSGPDVFADALVPSAAAVEPGARSSHSNYQTARQCHCEEPLARNEMDTPLHSRGAMRPGFAKKVRLLNPEGAGNAGRAMHPQPRV
jgi:hypothetical protein